MPLPLPHTLHYRLPERLRQHAVAGSRVRVQVGKRRVVGIVVAVNDRAPEGIELRDVDDLLDQRPVLTAELMRLGAFIADYYMSPIGETLRALVPARLPASGAARVRLTKRGVFLPTTDGPERDLVEALIAGGDTTVGDLAARFPGQGFAETLERLESTGYVSMSSGEGSGARYRAAVELPAGDLDRQLEAAGRSAPGARWSSTWRLSADRPLWPSSPARSARAARWCAGWCSAACCARSPRSSGSRSTVI